MEITINNDGQDVTVEISVEVYECLDEYDRKSENLAHEQRRHWDGRERDEYIIASESRLSPQESPEDAVCRMETRDKLLSALALCTSAQRDRLLLHALYEFSYSEIGTVCGCSKESVRESVESAKKKVKKYFADHPDD